MKRVNALMGIAILAVLSACAKQEPPAPQDADDPQDVAASAPVAQSQPEAPPPMAKDRSKAAADMIAFIDPAPQCQPFRDELAALGQTQGSIDDLSGPYVRAYQAGCVMKKQQ